MTPAEELNLHRTMADTLPVSRSTQKTEPTPRPWYLTPLDTPTETRENFISSLCIESDAGFVCRMGDVTHALTPPKTIANAALIIRAVNRDHAFDALLESCKATFRLGEGFGQLTHVIAQARAAIKLVEENNQ